MPSKMFWSVSWKKLVSELLAQYSALMSFIIELWMPILVSAVFVFIVSSVLHTVLVAWHGSDCQGLKAEADVMRALRDAGDEPGEYMMPYSASMEEMKSPEYCAKMNEGPVGRVTIMAGNSFHMGSALVKWFGLSLVISVMCAYVTTFASSTPYDYIHIFRLTGVTAFCAYSFGYIHNYVWAGTPAKVAIKFVVDGLLYSLVTAGTFGWLMAA